MGKKIAMNSIEALIRKHCPDGVEFKKLGEVCEFRRGTTITAKNAAGGNVPVIAGGQAPAYYHNVDNRKGATISVSSSGAYAGFVAFWDIPVFLSDSFSVHPDPELLLPKYLFYFLKNIQEKIYNLKKGGGIPHVHGSDLAKFLIPIPPLAIQQEIANILDKFTELEEALEAELEARKKQYEYYRSKLLTFDETSKDIRWMTLGEICIKTENIKWKEVSSQEFLYIDLSSVNRDNNQIAETQVICFEDAPSRAQQIVRAEDVIFGTTRPTLKRFCFITPKYDGQICSTGFCVLRANKDVVLPKYLFFILTTVDFYNYVENYQEGAGYPSITNSKVFNYIAGIPPLQEQARIVAILDKFDALVNDIAIGLPAEIKMRRKQYEYYRNKLLTFKKRAQ
ncbi:MAG: restriction endonuclease subunit S [Tannerellaceae bacterium]|nr:restriction endonuclease subunit S [Tannerellaceae bacterium]